MKLWIVQCHYCRDHDGGTVTYHFDEDSPCPECNAGRYWQIVKDATQDMIDLAYMQRVLRDICQNMIYAKENNVITQDLLHQIRVMIDDFDETKQKTQS